MITSKFIDIDERHEASIYLPDEETAVVFYYYMKKNLYRLYAKYVKVVKIDHSVHIGKITSELDRRAIERILSEFQENYEQIREEVKEHLKRIFDRINTDRKFYFDHFDFHTILKAMPLRLDAVKVENVIEKEFYKTYYLKDLRSTLILYKYFSDKVLTESLHEPYFIIIRK